MVNGSIFVPYVWRKGDEEIYHMENFRNHNNTSFDSESLENAMA